MHYIRYSAKHNYIYIYIYLFIYLFVFELNAWYINILYKILFCLTEYLIY